MATVTPNLGLVKLDPSDNYDRRIDNENLDKIDLAYGTVPSDGDIDAGLFGEIDTEPLIDGGTF